ncbi:MAG: ATP-binding protein [Thermoplasmata archaeon]
MEAEDLIDFNPWWSSGRVPDRLIEEQRRDLFQEIKEKLPSRQIISIVGLRRTGKTSLMYQLIDDLLDKGTPEDHILYFSFDKRVDSIEDIVKTYKREILMEDCIPERTFFFFDEIQKLDDWENQVKLLYDKKYPLKILLSGSSSLTLQTGGKETLAGRNYVLNLTPLTYREYLKLNETPIPEFKGIKRTYSSIKRDKENLLTHLHRFINFHGLPETIGMDENSSIEYTRSSLIDQVIYKDIPAIYRVDDPSVLREMLRIIAERPGMLLRFDSLSSDLSRTRQTISNYVFYLENAFLLRLMYNYSGSFITSAKKLKKVYFTHPSIVNSLKQSRENMGRLIENLVVSELGGEFFHRKNRKEIDIILRWKDHVIPVEIKYRDSITERDEKVLRDFRTKQKLEMGLILTKDTFEIENDQIAKVPTYYFLLYKKKILDELMNGVER